MPKREAPPATAAERKRLQRAQARKGHVTAEALNREIARQFKAQLLRKPPFRRGEMAAYYRLAFAVADAFPKDRDRALQSMLPDMGAAERDPAAPRKRQVAKRHKRARASGK
jgi:hypothetical protein